MIIQIEFTPPTGAQQGYFESLRAKLIGALQAQQDNDRDQKNFTRWPISPVKFLREV